MKLVKRIKDGEDRFYVVDVIFLHGSQQFYPKQSGYVCSVIPITLWDEEDVELDSDIDYQDIELMMEEYEVLSLLFESSTPSQKGRELAEALVTEELIDTMVEEVEKKIKEDKDDEKEITKLQQYMSPWYYIYNNPSYNNLKGSEKIMGKKNNDGIEKCKYYAPPTDVTFDDIAGLVEVKKEILEAIDIFKNADTYKEIGVSKKMNNILLSGSPGVGKTMLAKAISNYLDVPMFQASGDFVDKYVGTGANNVHTLFEDARKYAPCVIFIDECEQIAKQRTGDSNSSEREGATAKLLAELDGFETTDDILVIMATNNPSVLDEAFMRRMSKKIHITNPDYETRRQILEINAKKMKLEDDCDLSKIARNLSGQNGGIIGNIMNQAGILAVRKGKKKISQVELEEAMEREVCGLKSETKKLIEKEKQIVAYHELGHALLSYLKKSEKIQKISIIPTTSDVLGYCFYLNEDDNDKFLKTKKEILGDIMTCLAGRGAEQLKFGEVTGGASNDLEKATHLAETMICRLAMSDTFGLMSIDPKDVFMRQKVVREVNKILNDCYAETMRVLKENEELLDALAKVLIEKEVMDLNDFEKVLDKVGVVSI